MNTVSANINESQPAALNTAMLTGHTGAPKENETIKSSFGTLLHTMTPSHHSLPSNQNTISHKDKANNSKSDESKGNTASPDNDSNTPSIGTGTDDTAVTQSAATKTIQAKTSGTNDTPDKVDAQITSPAESVELDEIKSSDTAGTQTSATASNSSTEMQSAFQNVIPACGSVISTLQASSDASVTLSPPPSMPATVPVSQNDSKLQLIKQDNDPSGTSVLQNLKMSASRSAFLPESCQSITDETASKIKQNVMPAAAQTENKSGSIVTALDAQSSEIPADSIIRNFISSYNDMIVTQPVEHDFSTGQAPRDENKESTAISGGSQVIPRMSDAGQVTTHEAFFIQQTTHAGPSAGDSGSMQAENAAPTLHSLHDPGLGDDKPYLISNSNRLAVSLEPDGLGKLDINLSLRHGLVNAQIQAVDPTARNLIENNIQNIMNSLVHEGLNVGGFSVSLKHNEAGNADEQASASFAKSQQDGITRATSVSEYDVNGRINIFV